MESLTAMAFWKLRIFHFHFYFILEFILCVYFTYICICLFLLHTVDVAEHSLHRSIILTKSRVSGQDGLTDPGVWPNSSSDSENEVVGGELQGSDPPTYLEQAIEFTLTELAAATNNFNADCLLGEGGFGPIYKGNLESREGGFGPIHTEKLKSAGYIVAIRRLDHPIVPKRFPEFCNEVTKLSELDNPNIVDLIGYCIEEGQRFLVYEYMTHGSLEARLFRCGSDMMPLDWKTQMEISSDVADGLYYLHVVHNPPIIHRNLKCSNILLGEKYKAKLSDFGLIDKRHGFCVCEFPEIGKSTVESDIYAFGVVLLEIITGRKSLDSSSTADARNLVAWAKPFLKDRNLVTQLADKSLERVSDGFHRAAILVSDCLHDNPSRRPQINEIKRVLTFISIMGC